MKKLFRLLRRNYLFNRIVRVLFKYFIIFSKILSKKLIVYWPVSGNIKVDILSYQIKFFSEADDALISKLYYGIKWEEVEIKLFDLLCRESKVIFDIGANIGLYSLIAAKSKPDKRVHCFEPNPYNFIRLKKNVSINQLNNQIELIEKAVGATKGEVFFYLPAGDLVSDVSSVYRSHTQSFSDFKINQVKVDLISIDDYINSCKIWPDLIKIDVELYEFDVLKGMNGLLSTFSPVLLCEVFNDTVKIKENTELQSELLTGYTKSIENFLKKLGYGFYLISTKGVLRVNDLRSNPESSMYLFTKKKPKNSFYLINELSDFVNEIYS